MALIEEFVVRVYSSKLEGVTTVKRARYELFTYAGQDFDHLPPTKNALDFHTLRAAYIAGHIWGQALVLAIAVGLRDEGQLMEACVDYYVNNI